MGIFTILVLGVVLVCMRCSVYWFARFLEIIEGFIPGWNVTGRHRNGHRRQKPVYDHHRSRRRRREGLNGIQTCIVVVVVGCVFLGIIYFGIKVVELLHKTVEAIEHILTVSDTFTEKTEVGGWFWGVSRVITKTAQVPRHTLEDVYGYITGRNRRELE